MKKSTLPLGQENNKPMILKVPMWMIKKEVSLGIIIEDEVIYGDGKAQMKARKDLHRAIVQQFQRPKEERYSRSK